METKSAEKSQDRSKDTFNNMTAIARSGFGISTSRDMRDVSRLRKSLENRCSIILQKCNGQLEPFLKEVEIVFHELRVINQSVSVRSTYSPQFVDSLVKLAAPEGLVIVQKAARASGIWEARTFKRQRSEFETQLQRERNARNILECDLAKTRAILRASLVVLSASNVGVVPELKQLWDRVQHASLSFQNYDSGLGMLTVAASARDDEFEQKCTAFLSLLSC